MRHIAVTRNQMLLPTKRITVI